MVVSLINEQPLAKIKYYILEDKEPVKTEDALTWATWFQENEEDRYVAKDTIHDSQIITFFLGIITENCQKLFQAIVIGGQLGGKTESYSTWQEAVAGHKRMVERIKFR